MIPFECNQLVLPLVSVPVFSFDNFTVGSENRVTFQSIVQFVSSECTTESLILVGGSGTGKTHLLKATLEKLTLYSGHLYLHIGDIWHFLSDSPDENKYLKLLARYQNISFLALDGLELLENNDLIQEFVLYFFNILKANHGKLLAATRNDPGHISGLRVELKSRLLWGSVVHLGGLNDNELARVMKKIGYDRGLELSDELVNFLVTRLPRSPQEYVQALDQLDRHSSVVARNISIPLAKELFQL